MKKIRLSNILKIQSLILLYSLVSVLSKLASMQLEVYGLFSYQLIFLIFIMGILLVIYALFWQKILKNFDLSIAYVNKGMLLFWSLLWSILLFSEEITLWNILGTIIIILGILVVSKDE